ncbi:MAG: hypothetical protein R3183_05815 [Oleiphilaceae bacterium]|nr:hypothetical protein [Oleiphilaceae bacterium]
MAQASKIQTLLEGDTLSAITFQAGSAHFAVPLQQVLYIEKDVSRHSELKQLERFSHEVITFQNQTVELYDFNALVGAEGHREHVDKLIARLNTSVEALQQASTEQAKKAIRGLAQWLKDAAKAFEELADLSAELLPNISAYLNDLNENSDASRNKLRQELEAAKQRAPNALRPIILFLEHHNNKISALRLDKIEDIANYPASAFDDDNSTDGILKQDKGLLEVIGFLRNEEGAPTILLNCTLNSQSGAPN